MLSALGQRCQPDMFVGLVCAAGVNRLERFTASGNVDPGSVSVYLGYAHLASGYHHAPLAEGPLL